MHPAVRSFYNLEEVWGGKAVRLKKDKPAPAREKPAAKKKKKKAAKRGAAPRRRAKR
jgi:ribosome-associated protein